MQHETDGDIICYCFTGYSHQRIGTGRGKLGNKRTSGDNPNCSIFKICQNTEKSLGNLRRLVVTQTRVEHHQLTLV